MFEDNPIIIDVNSKKNKKQKILCVLCRIQLDYVSELKYKCPRCKNTYQLGYEILEHEDDFESSHSEDENIELSGIESLSVDSVGLLSAIDDIYSIEDDDDSSTKPGKIKVPSYMKSGEGRKVVEYHEE